MKKQHEIPALEINSETVKELRIKDAQDAAEKYIKECRRKDDLKKELDDEKADALFKLTLVASILGLIVSLLLGCYGVSLYFGLCYAIAFAGMAVWAIAVTVRDFWDDIKVLFVNESSC